MNDHNQVFLCKPPASNQQATSKQPWSRTRNFCKSAARASSLVLLIDAICKRASATSGWSCTATSSTRHPWTCAICRLVVLCTSSGKDSSAVRFCRRTTAVSFKIAAGKTWRMFCLNNPKHTSSVGHWHTEWERGCCWQCMVK